MHRRGQVRKDIEKDFVQGIGRELGENSAMKTK